MEMTLSTPALLFPAISLLMLAYTNKFLGLASVIRQLHAAFAADPSPLISAQIAHLRRRIRLTRDMQFFGVLSLFSCVGSMVLLFQGFQSGASLTFAASLVLMLLSLLLSLIEILISVDTLDMLLKDMEKKERP
jgi:hypothetical protein